MAERSRVIFGNPVGEKAYRKAVQSKQKYLKRFGDDSEVSYPVTIQENPVIGELLGVQDIRVGSGTAKMAEETGSGLSFDQEKGIIVGNIRMGFGHYRISMAIASAAHAMGYTPYWMDLNSYPETSCTKVISAQNDLYSMGSRLSQKSRLFNKLFWEPMNYEGFRRLSYNASDQKNAEIMAAVFRNIPKEIPLVGTHVWPAQAALHGGMRYVVNAIPDNWPMALHLAEGSVHTIQTLQSYQGYRILNGMKGKEVLQPMPADSLVYTGHYIDDELVKNMEADCEARVRRKKEGAPMRFLLTIGGAGAQKEIFAAVIRHLIPAVKKKKAILYVNVGDYRNVWDELISSVAGLEKISTEHFDDWKDTRDFAEKMLSDSVVPDETGVHAFWHKNIFEAVYCTNLLMRSCDVLLTKPSELAYYPVPKLFIRRIGGHEKWGAIHSAEIGDGTLECRDIPHVLQMLDMFLYDEGYLEMMCSNICRNKQAGIYDGAYKVVELAMGLRKSQS
ncbi:MAG: hypothetical protein IKE31_07420 [Eubacterium sp.]|nr:hypothetical protein [Eubacterium sp.]